MRQKQANGAGEEPWPRCTRKGKHPVRETCRSEARPRRCPQSRDRVAEHCAIDVRGAVEIAPLRERMVCRALGRGYSKNDIARMLGCGWHTVDRLVHCIREHFRQLGIEELGCT